ncbi:hypothetical protein Goari_014435 [Gossypium aridum]|uniref:Uncharacterized protein n=1 Tax=Gossypium aridum TaxID=34290 RepID=A0A7J8XJD5_GOSAI|nr:hypothetical protein [Gossypium aridum]
MLSLSLLNKQCCLWLGLSRVVTLRGMERDEISLLEEELIQLSVKSLLVVTDGKPTLCIVWTKKSYNLDSFQAQLKVFGRLRRNLRYRLLESMERSTIRLVASPFWVKVGPCPPKCDQKDLIHAIGSTFGGVLRSKVKGDFCKIKVQMNVQKPSRKGIFILTESQ